MASNFSFLRTQFPGLEKTGEFAERYLYSDSNSCLFKLGLLCEDIVNKMFDFDNIAMPYQMKDTLVNKIRLLENEEYYASPALGRQRSAPRGYGFAAEGQAAAAAGVQSLRMVHAGVW